MELKKTPKANLEKKRKFFLIIGFVISLVIVLITLNISDTVKPVQSFGPPPIDRTTQELPEVPSTEKSKSIPLPKIKNFDKIIINDDTSKIDEIDFPTSEPKPGDILDSIPKLSPEQPKGVDSIFVVVEEMPEFPGGQEGLLKWIAKNIKYPAIAIDNNIQGIVYVQFVVDKVGKICNVSIVRGIDSSLNQEALRVINNLPKWKPGLQRGKPVKVSYTVPINFRLEFK